ncbi:MAG: hypothetical protein COX79_02445 [Candidatus Levybacteria bacterium CG_4_10_14_0_2_um_filter_36_16]|nr:MAG: hypothetical protein COU26_03995 [Candidatus Levybacteria bacterium CG10_big_fil_rev_8_21_14_0_10_36_30]PIZ97392.1 MAG: hypothetical protein COX79_02445 [Candidatus Levybacteria bacterium CG_4_10_14_0_2_um_filter_36_16]
MKKSKNLVTEEFLEEKLLDLREGIIDQVNFKNRQYKDEIMTGLDKVVKELETIREDSIVGTHQIRELRVDVDNHEKRISKLEQTAQ